MTTTDSTRPTEPQSVPRWEWAVVIGLVLVTAGLRFAYPGRLAVEHFDEGVYASNIWFGDRPEQTYPLQHLYAPPLLPALIEWGFVFLGPSNAGAMWPSQLAGTITVILLWRLVRTWFGPVAGLSAATLCALSDVHVVLSRSALTDVLLGMWWIAALLVLKKACESGRPSHCLTAGFLVGLAWYTKYNGWMPLAITIAAVMARGVFCRGIWPQTRRALTSCLLAGIVAFAVWSPWLWSLQPKGGYASVMANHRQYVVGFGGWGASFWRQWCQLSALSGMLTAAGLPVVFFAMLAVAFRRSQMTRNESVGEFQFTLSLEPVEAQELPPQPASISLPTVTWLTTFVWLYMTKMPVVAEVGLAAQGLILWWLWSRSSHVGRGPVGQESVRSDNLGYWILAVWFVGLLVATPLYRPYLRLTLPGVLATCCGVGVALQLAWNSLPFPANGYSHPRALRQFAVVAAMAYAVCLAINYPIWHRRSLVDTTRPVRTLPLVDQGTFQHPVRKVVAAVETAAKGSDGTVTPSAVYVFAEPGLLFQLRNSGLPNVAPAGGLDFVRKQFSGPELKVYLVTGVNAETDPRFAEQFESVRPQLKLVGAWNWQLSPLVSLDQPYVDPLLLGINPGETAGVILYEVVAP